VEKRLVIVDTIIIQALETMPVFCRYQFIVIFLALRDDYCFIGLLVMTVNFFQVLFLNICTIFHLFLKEKNSAPPLPPKKYAFVSSISPKKFQEKNTKSRVPLKLFCIGSCQCQLFFITITLFVSSLV
jgi:hypothetical protein